MLSLYLLIRDSFVLSFPDGKEVKRLMLGKQIERLKAHISEHSLQTVNIRQKKAKKRERRVQQISPSHRHRCLQEELFKLHVCSSS